MTLVKIDKDDLCTILDWRNNDSVRTMMAQSHIITVSEHVKWFNGLAHRNDSGWFIYIDKNNTKSGVVYYKRKDFWDSVEWGFYKAPGSPPGTGFTMCSEALNFFRTEIGIKNVYGTVLTTNLPSLRLHLKLGFSITTNEETCHSNTRLIKIL